MKSNVIRNACGASLGLLTILIWASAASPAPEELIKRWPDAPRKTAARLLEKYGRPDQFDGNMLAWFNTGEWKRTIIRRKPSRRGGKAGPDFLEQTVGYLPPRNKIDELKSFHPSLEVSAVAGELTFASDSEEKNRLALNLADEVAAGKRTPADARAAYLKTSRLALSGKASPYLDALQFEPDNTRVMIPTGADR